MTDKEQIIIDGVDVGECKFFNNITESHYCLGIPCKDRPYCYFKQLVRKTQECEELKKYIQEREVWGDHCEFCKHNDKENCYQNIILDNLKTINRYRKALEEIEGIIKQTKQQVFCQHCAWYNTDGCNPSDKICGDFIKILDIINLTKAKGGGTE